MRRKLRSVGAASWGAVVAAMGGLLGLCSIACSGSGSGSGSAVPGGGTGGSGGMGGITGAHLGPWTELQSKISVEGGSAPSMGGIAQDGGLVHLLANADVSLDPSLPAPGAPDVPDAPADATVATSDMLAADVSAPGAVRVDGNTAVGGADAVRTITANSGDLFVLGTLRTADLGGARQGLNLNATGGTVYIKGTVDASGAAGTGQAGGPIKIVARRVAITGKLLAAGADSAGTAGPAGGITIIASDAITITGAVDAFGGNATGAAPVAGGRGGDLTLQAGGDVAMAGTVRLRGGAAVSMAADAQGGDAAVLKIDADGNVTIGGTVDARGGMATATSAGGAVRAGGAGAIHVGEGAPPTTVAVLVPISLAGGSGDVQGGKGGTITLEPDTGTITVAGAKAIDASGGGSLASPGAGGVVQGSPRRDPGNGGFHLSGEVVALGGSIGMGGSGNGADGGNMTVDMIPTDGAVVIDPSAKITLDGGSARGAGVAGGGGILTVFTKDGDITMGGTVSVRGGSANDPGGKGGLGGQAYFFSDNNHNALTSDKGNLLVTQTGLVDASGGDGATGGDARNDGMPGLVAPFPEHQEQIAIFLNNDGVHGNTLNWLNNLGKMIARGGVHNGNGGDIVFHGDTPGVTTAGQMNGNGTPNYTPLSGNVDMAGDGTGVSGDYRGE